MKILMAMAAVVMGTVLAGCMADNSYVDAAEEAQYQKARTSWRENRPHFGAAYNESANETEVR